MIYSLSATAGAAMIRFTAATLIRALAALLPAVVAVLPATAAERAVLLQSTTSTQASGLYDYLLPLFQAESGIRVNVVAVGTGQAVRNARNCDGDVLIVHDKPTEEAFIADGGGVRRFDLMYNDFIIVGPADDPAGIAGRQNAAAALAAIAGAEALFASRGDDSGTHKKELSLWRKAGIAPSGGWYRAVGAGMGTTLNAAVGMGAYVLTDRATWIAYINKRDFKILQQGDPALFNQYGVIQVNPAVCPDVRAAAAQRFIDWLLSPRGQQAIADYRVDGQQLFYPNAGGD